MGHSELQKYNNIVITEKSKGLKTTTFCKDVEFSCYFVTDPGDKFKAVPLMWRKE